MFIKAEQFYERENYEKALDLLEKCLTLNRRSNLAARSPEQKSDVNKEHAKIRILEGKIKFKMGKFDEAILSYNGAREKLISEDKDTTNIKAHLNYQMSRIAITKNDQEQAVDLMKKTVQDLVKAERYENAIKHIFKMIKYCSFNNFDLDFAHYLNKIDNLNKKKIKNKEFKKIHQIKVKQSRSDLYYFYDIEKSQKELLKVKKDCEDLGIDNQAAMATITLAQYEMYKSIKNAEKMLWNLIAAEYMSIHPRELGLAKIQYSIIQRMKNEKELYEQYEAEGLSQLISSNDEITLAEAYIDIASTIMMTNNDQDQFDRGKKYVKEAFDIFSAKNIKAGKVIARLLEGALMISRNNLRKGNSIVSLAVVNARRLGDNVVKLRSKFNLYLELLTDEVDAEFGERIDLKFKDLPDLERAALYHIHGLLQLNEDKDTTMKSLNTSMEIYEKIAKKEKSLSIMSTILKLKIDMLEFMTLSKES